jgi:hypothetical protein
LFFTLGGPLEESMLRVVVRREISEDNGLIGVFCENVERPNG